MKTVEDSTLLARTMLAIARGVGLRVTAVVSEADQPLGHAVGNALEVREAIAALRGEGPTTWSSCAGSSARRCC